MVGLEEWGEERVEGAVVVYLQRGLFFYFREVWGREMGKGMGRYLPVG